MDFIGVTGPIASGKTSVCHTFSEMGALLIDADKMGHEFLEEPSNRIKLLEYFGEAVIRDDNTIDRERISQVVFSNQSALEWLENLTHPLLTEKICFRIKELRESGFPGAIILDAAMLPKWPTVITQLDYLILVQSPSWQRINRLVQDRGYPPEQIEKRMNSQGSIFDKITPQIDYIVKNNGDLLELKAKAVKVWLDIKHGGA
ncbi:dephospho-CoA kinase [bacterium]|nr:dephospho-CoA kinase [bacterium]